MTTPEQSLSPAEALRYSRHLVLPEVGVEGQQKLKRASVLIVGAGGLGSPVALYLAAAGIGRLGIVDSDVVDASNLQRQVLHGTADIGRSKPASATNRIASLNPHVEVHCLDARIRSANALDLIEPYDVVADCTDNFPARYLISDACMLLGKPHVYGSVFRFEGQASVFHAATGPCYRCLFPEPPPPDASPNCAEGGVLGVLPGVIGTIQATEAVKWILGAGHSLAGRLLLYDALGMTFREMRLHKDPGCPACGTHPTIKSLMDYETFCGVSSGTSEKESDNMTSIEPAQLKSELDRGAQLLLLDVRDPHEVDICRITGSRLIPLGQIEQRLGELDAGADIVCYCKGGGRSARAVKLLTDRGFRKVRNLAGGILAWADQVEPRMPKY